MEQGGPFLGSELVFPVSASVVGQEKPPATAASQLPGAGNEVGVDVRLGDVSDSQPLLLRRSHVGVHPAIGIDHHRFACGGAADQVRRLSQLVVVKPPEQHRRLPNKR